MEAIHIGKEIKKLLRQKDISATKLGQMTGRHNTVVYRWLRKRHLDGKLLMEISKVLEYDFFRHYCQCSPHNQGHQQTEMLEKQIQELKKENDYLKELRSIHELLIRKYKEDGKL